jgi:hypothetical protein
MPLCNYAPSSYTFPRTQTHSVCVFVCTINRQYIEDSMRRLISIIVPALLVIMGLVSAPQNAFGQFVTNTPASGDSAPIATQSSAANTTATSTAPSSGFGFATNTPVGPTSTPTTTPTATSTPTATPTNTNTPTATFTPTNTPTPTPTPNGPFSYPEGINPLTGLMYPDAEAQARRNLIVKISNYPPIVRPQSGVNAADIVYEYEAEGGVTRFAAIFRSQAPERVGSIRSARLLDIELATMYRALLTYSGTSEPIQQLLLGEDFFEFQLISPLIGHEENQSNNCDETPFCRNFALMDNGVAREHTLFGNTNNMWAVATRQNTNTGYAAFGFAFSEFADANGLPVNDVYVQWYGQADARWQYDAENERYIRFTDNQPHMDAADGEQLWADNLIIIEVPHVDRPDLFPEGATYTSLGVELWDQGRAYVMREGQWYQGYWRRRDREPGSALQVIFGDNTPIMLKPGRTWVTVVRGLGNVTVNEDPIDVYATATLMALTPSPTPLDIQEGD